MWVWSSVSGAEVAALLCVSTLLILIIWHFRTYGSMRMGRILGALAFSVYVTALFVFTQLPVPEVASTAWCEAYGYANPQFIPFESFRTIWLRIGEIGWGATLVSTLGLQVLLNVALFVPWGIFLVGYFRRSIRFAVLTGATLSLSIEVVQVTGLLGIYPCAYRLGDIDDLITNTTGAYVGAVLTSLIFFWMPKATPLQHKLNQPQPLTTLRRLTAFFINIALIWTSATTCMVLLELGWRAVDGRISYLLFSWLGFIAHAIAVATVMVIPALRGRGSVGMWVVRVAPYWVTSTGLPFTGRMGMRFLRSAVIAVPMILAGIPGHPNASAPLVLVLCVSALMTPLSREHRSLTGWITGSGLRDVRVGAHC